MTRRMLLTLLAILTGLSWQGGAVHARAIAVEAEASQGQHTHAFRVVAAPLVAGFHGKGGSIRPAPCVVPMLRASAPCSYSAQLLSDRARE